MSIYAIADLHLSFTPGREKPMDIFGDRWYDHSRRLRENWCSTITKKDTVIIPGDISWALKLEDAIYDLDWVDNLPGHKVFFKGNHDLWWNGITRLNRLYENITFIQNDFYFTEDTYICGTRGWLTPDSDDYSQYDEKVYKRELLRLESSLAGAASNIKKLRESGDCREYEILGFLHYPPVSKAAAFSGFQQLFEDYGVSKVFYGHVHGEDGFKNTIMGMYHQVEYRLISLDYLNCKPMLVKE